MGEQEPRGLQDVSPALQENQLTTVSKLNRTLQSLDLSSAAHATTALCKLSCPENQPSEWRAAVRKAHVIHDNNSLPPAPLPSKPLFPELRCQA